MQSVSNLYRQILAGADHWYEQKLVIQNVGTFYEDQLIKISTNVEMLQKTPQIGRAVASEISLTMLKPSADIPDRAKLNLYTRICNSSQQSEWLPQGEFFIDTRQSSKNKDGIEVLTIHGYDAMLRAERDFSSNTITGNSTDTAMVAAIASIMGVSVDARTYSLMNKAYTIPLPTGYSCREVLGYVAAMYVGCFVITETGKLRLISLTELPPETNYLIDQIGDAITFGGDRILV